MQTEEKIDFKLENHLILYIDLLGYKQQIEIHGEAEYLTIINDAFERAMRFVKITNNDERFIVKYKIFSDNIIVCSRFTGLNVYMNDFITMTKMMQKGFISRNILIRGALTIGNLYFNENYIYGSGLIKAYELESKCTVFPRIIIDHELYKFFVNHPESSFYIKEFQKDDDGYFFIDYSRADSNCRLLPYQFHKGRVI